MIEKATLLIGITMFSLSTYAQLDTFYINELAARVAPNEASYIRTIQQFEYHNVVRDFALDHTLHRVETYAGKTTILKQGKATYYHPSGKLRMEGFYTKGAKSGEWNYYTHTGEKLHMKEIFNPDGSAQRTYIDTFSSYTKSSGMVDEDGFRSGAWKEYHFKANTVEWATHYEGGIKSGEQLQYYPNGKLKRRELYKGKKRVYGKLYDENGKKQPYYPVYIFPQPTIHLGPYIKSSVPCAEALIKTGPIEIKCFVSKLGVPEKWEINTPPNEECRQHILTALQKVKKWKPAYAENRAVDAWYQYTLKYYAPKE